MSDSYSLTSESRPLPFYVCTLVGTHEFKNTYTKYEHICIGKDTRTCMYVHSNINEDKHIL